MKTRTNTEEKPNRMGGKTEGYNSTVLHANRQRKRDDAEERLSVWEKLTPKQQLACISTRRGESKRQVARIEEQIAAEKVVKA